MFVQWIDSRDMDSRCVVMTIVCLHNGRFEGCLELADGGICDVAGDLFRMF